MRAARAARLLFLIRPIKFLICGVVVAVPVVDAKGPCKRSQHCWAQHVASVCTPCCVLLRFVATCWMKFETGQTSEPTSANISIVSRSSKRGPTMLRSFAQHIQQCCAGARALHATYPHKYMRTRNQHGYCVPESFVFSSKHQTCCDSLRAFAHIG